MSSSDEGNWDSDGFDCEPVVADKNAEDIDVLSKSASTKPDDDAINTEEWFLDRPIEKQASIEPTNTKEDNRPPLLLIDFTVLSNGEIHNKNDINSVNNPDAKRIMLKQCTVNFVKYRDDTKLIETGTVRSCGQSVWRDALQELRREHVGHFWAPVFPPK